MVPCGYAPCRLYDMPRQGAYPQDTERQPLRRDPLMMMHTSPRMLHLAHCLSSACHTRTHMPPSSPPPCAALRSPAPPLPLHCRSPVAALQLAGYGVAFLGVCWYNYQKLQGIKANVTGVARPGSADAEKQPLLVNGNGHGKAVE